MNKKPSERLSSEVRGDLDRLGIKLFVREGPLVDVKMFTSSVRSSEFPDGMILLDSRLPDSLLNEAVRKEIYHLEHEEGNTATSADDLVRLLKSITENASSKVSVDLSGIIIPTRKTNYGTLVVAHAAAFDTLIRSILKDWGRAYEIPPHKWEEIVAGAFDRSGFDEVTLTPKSGDYGRDVIAVKKGIGSIKVLGSVKAYKPKLLVGYDDIRALLGVMSGERDTSKGVIVTTSDFPPNVMRDPNIAPFIPTRLELLNGRDLQDWLKQLTAKS